jgi:putative endonuclease
MKRFNLEKGSLGEDIAKDYLQRKGYKILEQNYENKYGEIDLVAKDNNNLVFTEVKTRIGEQFGTPEDAINFKKKAKLIKNAQAYVFYNKKARNFNSFRIDAVCIVLDENKQIVRIDHYQNITS